MLVKRSGVEPSVHVCPVALPTEHIMLMNMVLCGNPLMFKSLEIKWMVMDSKSKNILFSSILWSPKMIIMQIFKFYIVFKGFQGYIMPSL